MPGEADKRIGAVNVAFLSLMNRDSTVKATESGHPKCFARMYALLDPQYREMFHIKAATARFAVRGQMSHSSTAETTAAAAAAADQHQTTAAKATADEATPTAAALKAASGEPMNETELFEHWLSDPVFKEREEVLGKLKETSAVLKPATTYFGYGIAFLKKLSANSKVS
jgi:hypothetical protein